MEALRTISMQRDGDRMDASQLSAEMVDEVPQLAFIGGFRKFSS
jgi:hypothetical protein